MALSKDARNGGYSLDGSDIDSLAAEILERMQDGFYAVDGCWRFVYANRRACELWNTTRDTILGRVLWERFPQIAGTASGRQLRDAVEAGAASEFEYLSPLVGRWLWVRVDPIGRGITGVYWRDITDRKRADEALRASEQRLRIASETARFGYWVHDLVTGELWASATCKANYGLPPDADLSYDSVLAAIHPEYRDGVRESLQRALRERIDYEAEYPITWPDGSVHSMSVRGRCHYDENGVPLRSVGVTFDITERKRAQAERERLMQQLDAERARFATLIEHLPVGAALTDSNGRIVLRNPAYARYVRGQSIPSHNAETQSEWTGFAPDGRVLDPAEYPAARALRGEFVAGVEFLYRAPGKHQGRWVRVGALPVRDGEGRVAGAISVGVDITSEKRAQEALRQLNETLEERVVERSRQLEAETAKREATQAQLAQSQKMEAVGQLTGGVAHDFNNLLTTILGNLDLLTGRLAGDDTAGRMLRSAQRAAERGAKLTEQLLAFSRRQHLRPRTVDANRIVAGMSDMLARTIGGTVQVRTSLALGLWPARLDQTQMEIAILNLAINARDAMPLGGTIVVETANVAAGASETPPELAGQDCVRIAVADSGCGMTEEVLAKAFEPFFTTKELGKGTGLGLSQVYGLVRQSGGAIRLSSRVGQGTTVLLYLPRATEAPASEAEAQPSAVAAVSGRILVVDDDADVREITMQMLRQAGYGVAEAESGLGALEALARGETYDLILIDIAMPNLNGPETIRRIRERWPEQRVLFVTGYVDTTIFDKKTGDDPLIRKPFKLRDLADAVRHALRRARGNDLGKIVPLHPPRPA